jgi:hypothetical protein
MEIKEYEIFARVPGTVCASTWYLYIVVFVQYNEYMFYLIQMKHIFSLFSLCVKDLCGGMCCCYITAAGTRYAVLYFFKKKWYLYL